MKNVLIPFLLIVSGIFLLPACAKYVLKAVDDNGISLYNCSKKTTGVPNICFDSLITDSRCPTGGVCIWQGTAIVQVTFHENEQLHTFKMSLKGFPSLGFPADTTINGYKIIFTDLKPYPEINKPTPKENDIKATFSIKR